MENVITEQDHVRPEDGWLKAEYKIVKTPQHCTKAVTDTGDTCTGCHICLRHIEWLPCLSSDGARVDVVHGEVLHCSMEKVRGKMS